MVAIKSGDSYLVLMILNSENSGYCEENRLKISDRNIQVKVFVLLSLEIVQVSRLSTVNTLV
jgi:hypothetical protein